MRSRQQRATKGTGEGQIIQRTMRQTIFDRFTMPTIKRKKINVSIVIHLLPRSKRNKRSLTTMKKKKKPQTFKLVMTQFRSG
jgi:hypothetical protein